MMNCLKIFILLVLLHSLKYECIGQEANSMCNEALLNSLSWNNINSEGNRKGNILHLRTITTFTYDQDILKSRQLSVSIPENASVEVDYYTNGDINWLSSGNLVAIENSKYSLRIDHNDKSLSLNDKARLYDNDKLMNYQSALQDSFLNNSTLIDCFFDSSRGILSLEVLLNKNIQSQFKATKCIYEISTEDQMLKKICIYKSKGSIYKTKSIHFETAELLDTHQNVQKQPLEVLFSNGNLRDEFDSYSFIDNRRTHR